MNMLRNNSGFKPLSKIIGEMSVIASVQASSLGMTRLDRSASRQSDRDHNAMIGAATTSVKRLPGAESDVNAIKATHGQARQLVASRTSQWGKDRRLLPNIYIGEVSGEFEDIKKEHDRLRDDFVARSYTHIQRAYENLGTYDVTPPSISEIERAFSLELELSPVPDITAYTAGDTELEKHMKMRFEADIQKAYDEAQKDLMKRLVEPLECLVARMSAYDEREKLLAKDIDVGKTGTFKSTVITNITDIAGMFRVFNVTNDPALEAIAERLDAFDGIEHKDLTASATLRADTKKRAADIRKSLDAWL